MKKAKEHRIASKKPPMRVLKPINEETMQVSSQTYIPGYKFVTAKCFKNLAKMKIGIESKSEYMIAFRKEHQNQ